MKLAEWEKEHGYSAKRVCRYCKYATVLHNYLLCAKKSEAKAGSVVKPNHSCDLWEQDQ